MCEFVCLSVTPPSHKPAKDNKLILEQYNVENLPFVLYYVSTVAEALLKCSEVQ